MLMFKDRDAHLTVTLDFTTAAASVLANFALTPGGEYVAAALVAGTGYFAEDYVSSAAVSGDYLVAASSYFAEDYVATASPLSGATVAIARDYGDGLLMAEGPLVIDGLKVEQRVSGGTPGRAYDVAGQATFTDGQVMRVAATVLVT